MIKLLFKIFKIVSVLVVALSLILVLANLGDEELKPEVKQALNWQPPEHAFDNDNGYLILLGMDAPADQDAWQIGKQILETEIASKKTIEQIQKEAEEELVVSEDGKNISAKSSAYGCDYFKQQNCIEAYLKQDKAKMEADFAQFNLQLKRFAGIRNSLTFIEATPPRNTAFMFNSGWQHLINASHINRIKATLLIASGDFENGVSAWLENALFSRRLLKESSNLISRMVAVKLLQVDMRILSELIAKYPRLATYRQQLLPVVQPISGTEYNMVKVFQFERNLTLHFLHNNQDENFGEAITSSTFWSNIINYLFYKPNAFLNLFYEFGTLRLDLAKAEANQLDEACTKTNEKEKLILGFGVEPFYLTNPVGKVLVSAGNPAYKDYFERQHDTDGYIRLVGLQLALAAEKAGNDERIKQIMQNYPDPYTGRPMDFDSKTRRISFHGRQKSRVNIAENSTYTININ